MPFQRALQYNLIGPFPHTEDGPMDPRPIKDLAAESELWTREGIISADQRLRLLGRYDVKESSPGRRRLTRTMATLGSLLLGAGVILLIESNWNWIAPVWKLSLLTSAVLISYAVGFWLTVKENPLPAVAQAFYFLGAILYGDRMVLHLGRYRKTLRTARPRRGDCGWQQWRSRRQESARETVGPAPALLLRRQIRDRIQGSRKQRQEYE